MENIKKQKNKNGAAPMLNEIFMIFTIIVLWNINTYLCYDYYYLQRQLIFSCISLILFLFIKFLMSTAGKKIIRLLIICVYFILFITSVIVLINKQTTEYIKVSSLYYSIPAIIMLASVTICILISMVKNSKLKMKASIYVLLIFPLIIISALNSLASTVTALAVIIFYIIFDFLKSRYKFEKSVVFFTILSLFVILATIITAVISYALTNGYTGLLDLEQLTNERLTYESLLGTESPFIHSSVKCGLIFPLSVILLAELLFSYLLIKSTTMKRPFNFSVAFSSSLLLLLSTGLSVVIECITGKNAGFINPLFSLYGSQILIATTVFSFALVSISTDPASVKYKNFAKILQISFTKDVSKQRHTVFISYRREGGSEFSGNVYYKLREKHISPFRDVETMKNGMFNEKIYEKIDECDIFVPILTVGALDRCVNDGDWVRNEIAYALKTKKKEKIIPLMVNDFKFPDYLPDDVDKIRNVNAIKSSNEFFDYAIDELIKRMKL